MRIPEIQQRLLEISEETGNEEIRELALSLSRRKSFHRAQSSSAKMTDELRSSIRSFVWRNPDMPQTKVAGMFNVNPGRISEVMIGHRR